MSDLAQRTLLVAGSSRGIGAATARSAAESGATVIVHGRQDSPALRGLAAELGARWVTCDGTDPEAVHQLATRLVDDGVSIDTLVCTLGAVAATPVLDECDDVWINLMRQNVLAPLHFVQSFTPQLRASGWGRVVLVSSIRGIAGLASPEVAAYSAAKAALINLSASLAKELAPDIAVNVVVPGFALTDMSRTWSAEVRDQSSTALLGRPAEPSEIGGAVLFLASSAASFMTGEVLHVEGGYASAGK